MTQPIIDPSTLTDEQREAIKEEYKLNSEWKDRSNGEVERHWYSGRNLTLLWLFGEGFFKGENNE